MAIPANLINLIHQGRASFNTYQFGNAFAGILPVSTDKYMVITGIKFWHYLDLGDDGYSDFETVLLRSVKQLRLYSGISDNHFIIRQPIRQLDFFNEVQIFVTYDTWGHTSYDNLYLVHDENVQIDIVNSPDEEALVVSTFNPAPARTGKIRAPYSFGNAATFPASEQVISDQGWGGGLPASMMQTNPFGMAFNADFFVLPFSDVQSGQVQFPVTDFSAGFVNQFQDGRMARRYPLVHIEYVLVNEKWNPKIQGSH